MAASLARPAALVRPAARRRLLALALAAALAVAALDVDLRSAAFSDGSALLERPAPPLARKAASRQALEGLRALEPALEPRQPDVKTVGVDQNPRWANCFVQAQQETQSVLEEWVLRGERGSVDAFRAWRQDAAAPTAVRCVEMPEEEALRSVCLECASPGGAAPVGLAWPSAPAGVDFGSMSQCMAHTAMGLGFCKSGQVTMAF